MKNKKTGAITGKQVMFRADPEVAERLYVLAGKAGGYLTYVSRDDVPFP